MLRETLKPQLVFLGSNASDWNGNANSQVQPSASTLAFAYQMPSHSTFGGWLF